MQSRMVVSDAASLGVHRTALRHLPTGQPYDDAYL
jgi:hypothetical protein